MNRLAFFRTVDKHFERVMEAVAAGGKVQSDDSLEARASEFAKRALEELAKAPLPAQEKFVDWQLLFIGASTSLLVSNIDKLLGQFPKELLWWSFAGFAASGLILFLAKFWILMSRAAENANAIEVGSHDSGPSDEQSGALGRSPIKPDPHITEATIFAKGIKKFIAATPWCLRPAVVEALVATARGSDLGPARRKLCRGLWIDWLASLSLFLLLCSIFALLLQARLFS